MVVCPECAAGKHLNCTREAYNPVTDDLVPCDCPCSDRRYGPPGTTDSPQYDAAGHPTGKQAGSAARAEERRNSLTPPAAT